MAFAPPAAGQGEGRRPRVQWQKLAFLLFAGCFIAAILFIVAASFIRNLTSAGALRRSRRPRSTGRPEGRPSFDGLWRAATPKAPLVVRRSPFCLTSPPKGRWAAGPRP